MLTEKSKKWLFKNGYKKCDRCGGGGRIHSFRTTYRTCTTCDGDGIIEKPPHIVVHADGKVERL